MPKYWGKQIFTHRSFPEVGQKQKTEKERKEEDRKWVITVASYTLQRHLGWRIQSCLGQCKVFQAKSNDHLWSRKARQKLLLCIMDEWSKISTKKTTVKTLMTALSQPGFLDVKLRVEKLLLKNCPVA